MKRSFQIIVLCLLLAYGCQEKETPATYDVVVYGGTSAGIIAAYTAKTMGKSVYIIEPSRHLGGLTTGGLGYTDIGNKYAVTGLSRDFYRRLGKHYGKFEQWIFEPHVAKNIFQQYLNEAELEVLYEHRIVAAHKEDGIIRNITIENARNPQDRKTIAGKMFIDATYEGDLMATARVSYTIGREANNQYGERYNGVQLMTGHQFPDGIDPYKIPDDPSSGLLWGISNATLETDGTGDDKIQAYNFRICLTNDPANRVEITRPEGYDSTQFELLVRLFEAQPDKRKISDYFIWSRMPNNKTDINNRGGFSTDMIGMNHDYPEADYQQRQQIIDRHAHYTKSLLYFYKTDPRVPQELQGFMQEWGYPKDEYQDNGHWSPQLYVREVRRMVGEYVMTEANCVGDEVVEDGVGMAAYTMDSHNIQRIVVEKEGRKMVKNEGNVEIGGFGPYPISYRSLIPQRKDAQNLLVPVALSASHIAYGSIRMEPVFMVLAQSSAVAASLAIDQKLAVQDVDVSALQKILRENPLADGSVAEILVDNDDSNRISIKGNWERQARGGYGPSFLVDTSKGSEEKSVRFSPEIVAAGNYDVYAYFSRTPDATAATTLIVSDGATEKNVIVQEEDIRVEGQTSGEWVHLGRYRLEEGTKAYVEITNQSADGSIVADAVVWVPQK
ncbi:MAG TPA: FAD-dependent oxidoreductase [Cyclobacteriaceae bacterium]|nr:FAD-dependent oxidoreductase [Cyclobacteriaceae bacterium]